MDKIKEFIKSQRINSRLELEMYDGDQFILTGAVSKLEKQIGYEKVKEYLDDLSDKKILEYMGSFFSNGINKGSFLYFIHKKEALNNLEKTSPIGVVNNYGNNNQVIANINSKDNKNIIKTVSTSRSLYSYIKRFAKWIWNF